MSFFDNLSSAFGGGDNLLAASNALLQAGAPSRTPVGFGQALGMAGQSVVDAKKKQQQEAMQKMLLDLQLQQHQLAVKRGETEARQAAAKMAEQARVRDLLANAGKVRPGMGAGLPNGLLPPEMSTGQTFPALQQAGQIDYQELIRQGAPIEVVKALAESKNFGRSKVARTIDTEGPGGAKTVQGFDEYGAPVGQGVAGYVAPQLVDLGDRKTFAKPAAGQSFGMGQTPESKASNALGWANNALSRQRLAHDISEAGKPKATEEKPLNDVQSKALLFGSRMREADTVLESLAKSGTKASVPGSRAGYGIGAVVSAFSPAQQQQLDQAKRDFLSAVLRRESGAVISDSEFDNGDKQYFPQIGDSKEVIAQKSRNRKLATDGILLEVPANRRDSLKPQSQMPTADDVRKQADAILRGG